MKFDFSVNAENNTVPTIVPPGEYSAIICDSKEKTSKSGNQMLEIRLKITETNYWGTCVWDWLVFINNKPAKDKLKNFCNAVGIETEGGEVDISPNSLLNKQLLITIENVEFNGKIQNRVAYNGYKKDDLNPLCDEVPF